MVHPEDLERILPEFERYIQSGERYSGEFRIVGQNGKIYHYSNRGQAIRNAAGEPYKWIGLATDITETKLAEEAISQLAAIVQCSETPSSPPTLRRPSPPGTTERSMLLGYTRSEAIALSDRGAILLRRSGGRNSLANPPRAVLAAGRSAFPAYRWQPRCRFC